MKGIQRNTATLQVSVTQGTKEEEEEEIIPFWVPSVVSTAAEFSGRAHLSILLKEKGRFGFWDASDKQEEKQNKK